jgi:hypothetical protein
MLRTDMTVKSVKTFCRPEISVLYKVYLFAYDKAQIKMMYTEVTGCAKMLRSKFQVILYQGCPAERPTGATIYGATEAKAVSVFKSNVR